MGVFDRLQKEIEKQQRENGITALDIAELPPTLRRVMRLLLRKVHMSYSELLQAVSSFPESERLSAEALEEALGALVDQGWVLQIGTKAKAIYKVNLRRKSGSRLGAGIWNVLDEKLKR
ncbi:MAG: hypothetical protein WHS87_08195 [Anaerolineales bacterium]